MASLFDKLKLNTNPSKIGTQLFEGGQDTLASTVRQQGLAPGAAVSPLAASGLGVTKDQAKMAGTAAQVQSAVRESVAPGKQLAAPKPERVIASAAEQEAKRKQKELESIQGLGSRIATLIDQSVKAQAEAALAAGTIAKPVFKLEEFKKAYPGLSDEQYKRIGDSLSSGEPDVNLFKDLGIIPSEKSADEAIAILSKYAEAPTTTIATNLANTFGPDTKLAAFTPEQYQDYGLANAAKVLGLSDAEMQNLTINELQGRISALGQAEFSRAEELSRIANDAYYPASVREDAQRQLRELSSTGVLASEADMQKLDQAIQSADTVTIGDTTYTVQELLSDATLTSIVTAYLDPANAKYAETLKSTMPALAAFIESNKAALKTMSDKLGSGTKELAKIQVENDKLKNVNSVDMTGFNAAVIPGYDPDKPQKELITTTPAHQLIMNDAGVPPEAKTQWQAMKQPYTQFLADMANLNSDVAKEFAGYDYKTLMSKFTNSGYANFNEWVNDYTKYQRDINIVNNTNASDEVVVLNTLGPTSELNSFLKNFYLRQELGLGQIDTKYAPLYQMLDEDKNGQIDDLNTIRKRIKAYYGSSVNLSKDGLMKLMNGAKTAQAALTDDALTKAVMDGSLTPEEVDTVIATNDDKQLSKLYDILNSKGAVVKADTSLASKVESAQYERSIGRDLAPLNLNLSAKNTYQLSTQFGELVKNKSIPERKALYEQLKNIASLNSTDPRTKDIINSSLLLQLAPWEFDTMGFDSF